MVSKLCSLSHGQPVAGSRNAAMIPSRRRSSASAESASSMFAGYAPGPARARGRPTMLSWAQTRIENESLQSIRGVLPRQFRHALRREPPAPPRFRSVGEHALQGLHDFRDVALTPPWHGPDTRSIAMKRSLTFQREAILPIHQIEVTGVA